MTQIVNPKPLLAPAKMKKNKLAYFISKNRRSRSNSRFNGIKNKDENEL